MSNLPACPQCKSEYTYQDGAMYVCPECAHEWSEQAAPAEEARVIKDANGNDAARRRQRHRDQGPESQRLLPGGKVGTKVKNIRLVDGDHDIDCKIDGIGAMSLKSEFVKKA